MADIMHVITDEGKKPYPRDPFPVYVQVQLCNNPDAKLVAFALVDGKKPVVGQTVIYPIGGGEVDKALITKVLVQEFRPNMLPRDYVSTEPCGTELPPPPVVVEGPPSGTTFKEEYIEGLMPTEQFNEDYRDNSVAKKSSKIPKIPMYVWYLVGAVVIVMVGKKQKWF